RPAHDPGSANPVVPAARREPRADARRGPDLPRPEPERDVRQRRTDRRAVPGGVPAVRCRRAAPVDGPPDRPAARGRDLARSRATRLPRAGDGPRTLTRDRTPRP